MVIAMRTYFRSALVFLFLAGARLPSAPAQEASFLPEARVEASTPFPTNAIPASVSLGIDPVGPISSLPLNGPEDGSEICGPSCFNFNVCCRPCLYAQADALIWNRMGTGCNQTLVLNTNTGDPLLSTGNLNNNVAGGPRFLIGWRPDPCLCSRCCAWELSYFGIFGSNANAVVRGPGNLAIPGDLGLASNNFLFADVIGVGYNSQLHSLQLNCIKSCCVDDCLRLDVLCGLRYLSLTENYTITASDFAEGTSAYRVNATNNLFGGQFGGRLRRAWCRWAIELTGTAGIFYNNVQQQQVVTDFPNDFILRSTRGNSDGVAMLAELGAVFVRPINDSWNLRLGYSLFGLGGVALAPNQLDFSLAGGTHVDKEGWLLFHGGVIGLETRW
jgi:hypothetical protein